MTTPVAQITFDDLMLQVGKIYAGSFAGTAHLDEGGSVTGIDLVGCKEDNASTWEAFDVTRHGTPDRTWDDSLIRILAFEIERQYKAQIEDTLNDWRDGLKDGPEHDD